MKKLGSRQAAGDLESCGTRTRFGNKARQNCSNSMMDVTPKSPVDHLDQKGKEPVRPRSRNVDATTQCNILPTVATDIRHNSAVPAEGMDLYSPDGIGSVSRQGEASASDEQTDLCLRHWSSSPQQPLVDDHGLSLPLSRFLESTTEPSTMEHIGDSSQNDTAVNDEYTIGVCVRYRESRGQAEHQENEMRVYYRTSGALGLLDSSAIPPAEEYWAWNDKEKKYYHQNEDTQSLIWYGPLD